MANAQILSELERRLANVILVGSIIESNYADALVKAESGDLITGWLPWITTRAGADISWWAPEIGEQVLIICPNGDPELGIVLPAIYQSKYTGTDNRETVCRVRFADGADFSYDREAKALTINLPDGATTSLVSAGGVSITGDLNVTGKITASKDITSSENVIDKTRSMQADRDTYNTHTHKIPGGGSTVPTEQKQ